MKRILVVRLDLLGDMLFTLPLAEGLRLSYPDARISLLTSPYTAQLAALSPAVDEVISVDINRLRSVRCLLDPGTWRECMRVYRRLRAQRFDLAIAVYGQIGSLCAALAGARRTVGYAREAYPHLLSCPLPGGRHLERKHEVEYVRALARHVGVPRMPDHPSLRVPAAASEQMADKLRRAGIGATDRLIAIHAGSINGSAKRWPAVNWSRFAGEITARIGARIVLIGAASDMSIAGEVLRAATIPMISLVGKTDLVELVCLIQRADLVASGDSGPLHLAVVLGRPVLAVYGPTDPAIYGPYRPTAPVRLHRRDLACSPCYSLAAVAECPLGDPICMRLVTVEQMVESAQRLLAN